jgi:hypothetical protein
MTTETRAALEERLARFVAHHVMHGERLPAAALCEGRPDLVVELQALIAQYLHATAALEDAVTGPSLPPAASPLPSFEGFRTIERLGVGGMGEVYKLEDLRLGRIVAAKVVRGDRQVQIGLEDALGEARSLALFKDPRIVQIFEFRADATPPVIIMEFVEGFQLGRVGRALDYAQRARVIADVCEAIEHAHRLGIQHRDLKPSNIMLDARLGPKILDFGLSTADPASGHLRGTLPYMAPEQLDPGRPIDRRTDVYALGVILYELLCGALPYEGQSGDELAASIRAGRPRLPVEVDARVPEPLQAIALKAMEADPAARYQSSRDMAADLGRFLDGRPVTARPSLYALTLGARVRPHLEQIAEWLRLQLIYPHEAAGLHSAYAALEGREDDWILASRTLSYSQIVLYLGAFLLVSGSLFYFAAHRFYDAVTGVTRPFVVLGLPFLGLNAAARLLSRREHKAVAVAFYLGGVGLLPLFMLILFHESGLWTVPADTAGQLFQDGSVSNRQLQITAVLACAWSVFLALETRTAALSTVSAVLFFLSTLAVLTDFGLRSWLEQGEFDRLALHLSPAIPAYAATAWLLERSGRPWFARPLYVASAVMLVVVLELLALEGKAFEHLGVSMAAFQRPDVSDPLLLDTLTALTLNGLVFYAAASAAEQYGSTVARTAAWLLFTISPFAVLQPVGWLSKTGEYSFRLDWSYLALAVGIAVVSHRRQRKSFYYAGVINTGWALWLVASHREWFDKPLWAMAVIGAGLLLLLAGFALAARDRTRRPDRV